MHNWKGGQSIGMCRKSKPSTNCCADMCWHVYVFLQDARCTAQRDLDMKWQRLEDANAHIYQLQEQVAFTQVCVALNTASIHHCTRSLGN